MSTTTDAASDPKVTPMEALLGPKLLTKKGGPPEDTFTLLKGKQVVALYFSASWCPPCKAFTPMLSEFYQQAARNNGVEIVYVSSDKSQADFDAYYGKMPWRALPFDAPAALKNKLATTLQIQGIPSLVVLDCATGHLVTQDARTDVQRAGKAAAAQQAVVATWKATAPVPIEQALAQSNDPLSLLKRLVMTLLKNPIYMFAMLYFAKKAMRMLSGGTTANDAPEEAAAAVDHEPIPDDEF